MENEQNISEAEYESGPAATALRAAERLSDAIDVAIDLLEDVQKAVSGGRPKLIRIRFGDKIIADLPVALTAAAALATGVAAVLLTKLAVEIKAED